MNYNQRQSIPKCKVPITFINLFLIFKRIVQLFCRYNIILYFRILPRNYRNIMILTSIIIDMSNASHNVFCATVNFFLVNSKKSKCTHCTTL